MTAPYKKPLLGRLIAIVGNVGRQRRFEALISRMGGELRFIDCDRYREMEPAVRRADGVIHFTNYGSHAARDIVRNAARKHDRPVVFLHKSGANSLEQAIREQLVPAFHNPRLDDSGPGGAANS